MKNKKVYIFLLLIFLFPIAGITQKKSDLLKRQEKALIKKIQNTKLLIKQTRATEELTISELTIINKQIKYRERLIRNYNFQLKKMDENIGEINRQINALSNTKKILKEEYEKMILYAFKNRDPNYKFLYIISAHTFTEAFHRMKYIEHYTDYRIKQVDRIKSTEIELLIQQELLKDEMNKKIEIVDYKKTEKNQYQNDKNAQLMSLNILKKNEAVLAKELSRNNEKRKEIEKAVKDAIIKEIKESEKSKKSKFSVSPEGIAMSKNFINNKGRLYWPVERGEITSSYGKHQHHLVSTAFIDNNGIDITTSKNALVRSVFGGKVTSVLIIPGAGKVVMISHGEYRTVYANLQEVFVKKGEIVKSKENIGKLLAKEDGISQAHFEIWKISSAAMSTVNPSLWLSK
jgi:septal ring factor EnvC (AmiA/AmiB activator)